MLKQEVHGAAGRSSEGIMLLNMCTLGAPCQTCHSGPPCAWGPSWPQGWAGTALSAVRTHAPDHLVWS